MGRRRADASIPAPPGRGELPADYAALLVEIKERIRTERVRVVLAANQAMVLLYWDIGKAVLARQEREGSTSGRRSRTCRILAPQPQVHARLGRLARREIVQRAFPGAVIWRCCTRLPETPGTPARRNYSSCTSVRDITNFPRTLPPSDSDLATLVQGPVPVRLPRHRRPRTERELEQGLADHIQRFLLEMGAGFAFVGRQVLLEVGDSDFRVDLLFYHLQLRRFVVVELKAVPFSPAFVGQMNLYLSAVDDLMRHPDDTPTIGLLLCKGKDRMVVEYALRDLAKPLDVADWETRLVDILPDDLKGSLPTIDEIEAELHGADGDEG